MIKRGLVILIMLTAILSIAQNPESTKSSTKLKYEFVPNHGQWHPLIRYKANIPFGHLYLESDALHYNLIHPDDYKKISTWRHENTATPNLIAPRKHSIRMKFLGMTNAPRLVSNTVQDAYYNYYIGSDRTKWASKIHPAGKVTYENVYEGIDLEISGVKSLKYQWVINEPTLEKISKIKIALEGADTTYLDNGSIVIKTSAGEIRDEQLYVYQLIDNEVLELNAHYVLSNNQLTYKIEGEVNPKYPLIIDPELIFSTYSGTFGDNFGFTATYDSKANLYAGGIVDNNQGQYPVTSGAYDTSWNGGTGTQPAGLACDISISKYDSAGSKLLWATFLGGSNDEYPHSLVVDRNDDLLIYGTTYSANYPYTTGCFDSTHGGSTDIIISKLSEDGTTLIGSTFIGSDNKDGLNQNSSLKYNYSDDFRGDIITDDDGNLFVASVTFSDNMPLVNASQQNKGNGYDGYLFSLSGDCKSMLWGTYLGGNGADALYSIKLDQHQNIYVGGGTTSSNLASTDSTFSDTLIGKTDGLIAIFGKKNKQIKRLSYWGTEDYDQIYFIDIDAENKIFATGQTEGNVTQTPNTYGESGKGQFILRIDTLLKNIDLQTTFGVGDGDPQLTPSAFLVDLCDHIYFSGWGSSVDPNNHPGTTTGLPVSSDAHQKTTDGNDFYVIVLGRNAENLLYATYFGGDRTGDHVDGGTSRFDKKGVVYQSVCASCDIGVTPGGTGKISDFPVTAGAAFEINESNSCSNASFKLDLQIRSAVISDFVATPTIGCAPLDVQFTSTSVLGRSFLWDFGDGDTSQRLNPKHIFTNPGIYTVSLTVVDSGTCNIVSTYERTIEVLDQGVAEFTAGFNGCDNELTIVNQSEGAFSYRWDFGDGNTSTETNPDYQYEVEGNYTITLFVNENTLCSDEKAHAVTIDERREPTIKLYNVFTPNGDGLNDCFIMDGEFLECREYLLKIYNRWGEQVFSTPNPNECWRGNDMKRKEILPSGTYYYLLFLGKNVDEPISGIVELIKE